jgi:hypothetical protein
MPTVELWAAFVFLTGLVLAAGAFKRRILTTFSVGFSWPGLTFLVVLLEAPGTDPSDLYAGIMILLSIIFWSGVSGGIGLVIGALGRAAVRKRTSN